MRKRVVGWVEVAIAGRNGGEEDAGRRNLLEVAEEESVCVD